MKDFDRITAEIDRINWAEYETAYGSAASVPEDLKLLLFGSRDQAMEASHRLWCALCHQHAFVSSAAEPALEFILLALDGDDDVLKVEVLDIILGFAVCGNIGTPHTVSIVDRLIEIKERFKELEDASSGQVSEFAADIHDHLCQHQEVGRRSSKE